VAELILSLQAGINLQLISISHYNSDSGTTQASITVRSIGFFRGGYDLRPWYRIRINNFFSQYKVYGLPKHRLLHRFLKDKFTLVTKCIYKSYSKETSVGPTFTFLFEISFFQVHYVSKVSLYSWNLRKIQHFQKPLNTALWTFFWPFYSALSHKSWPPRKRRGRLI
jgi:hypothetical protein